MLRTMLGRWCVIGSGAALVMAACGAEPVEQPPSTFDVVRTDARRAETGSDAAAPDATAEAGRNGDAMDASSPLSPSDAAQCPGEAPRLLWPLAGAGGIAWVVTNYVDLDPTDGGLRDFHGTTGPGAHTYDGHLGIDVSVSSFREMDLGIPVRAAAPGTVVWTHDGEPDRNTACAGEWNAVRIRHAGGFDTIYGHLRRGSVRVHEGDAVSAGDPLGLLGSSGCSTGPHVHFEMRDCANAVIDPMQRGLVDMPPAYQTPLHLFDGMLREAPFQNIPEVQDPPPNPTQLPRTGTLSIALSVAGGNVGDRVGVDVMQPDGQRFYRGELSFVQAYRQSYWWWNVAWTQGMPGTWSVVLLANGAEARRFALEMR